MLRRLPRFPLLTFAWTRAAIFLGAALMYQLLQAQGHGPNGGPVPARFGAGSGWAIDLWGRWDAGWFLKIVEHGYEDPHAAAFFPLYPLFVRVVAWPLGGRDVLAGVLVSTAASAVAVVLLYELARHLLDEDDARRSVVYLLLFPTSLFLCAVYSESLYLALSIGMFLAAVRGKWLVAGVLCGLAILTRSAGVVLLAPLVLLAWQSVDRRRALIRAAIALPIAAVWPLWLWIRLSDPFLFVHAQHEHFGRHLSAGGPFGGVWWGLVAGWNGIRQFLGPNGANYFPQATDHPPAYTAALNLEQLGFAIIVIVLGILAWRRLGAAYGVFVLGSMLLPLSTPTQDYPLLSSPRFALGMFPIFIALATLGRRRNPDLAITAICALYLGMNLARWVLYAWVA